MSLRFTILKTVSLEGDEEIALEYDQDQIRERLVGMTMLNLRTAKKKLFSGYSGADIEACVAKAFDDLVIEFKRESIRIK